MRAMAYYVFSNWYACAVVSHSKLCCILMRCMRMQSAQAAVWKVQDISARDSSSSCSRSCCAGVHTLAACLCIAHRDVCVRRLCDAAFTNCINTCIKDAKRPWVTAIPKDISCQTIIYTLRPLQSWNHNESSISEKQIRADAPLSTLEVLASHHSQDHKRSRTMCITALRTVHYAFNCCIIYYASVHCIAAHTSFTKLTYSSSSSCSNSSIYLCSTSQAVLNKKYSKVKVLTIG